MIGATTSQTLDLTLLNKGDIVYGTSTIKVEIGLKIGSIVEYIPIGIYNIDDIEKTDYTIKITAYDNMIKFERNFTTSLGDTLTLQQVVSELTRITGVQFTGSLPSYTVKKLEGFTCREILSYVASLCGGNAVITRDGKFTIVTPADVNYSIGTSNYFDYKREETKYKIGKISCQAGEEILSKGSIGADTMELEFENSWITSTILTDVYTKLNGFEYLGYSMKWQGDPSIDVGDIVTITDKKGVVRKHPILYQKFTYTGGLTSEIGAKGENKNKNEFSSSGSTAKKVERVVMELALINRALIDVAYIGDLTANNIKFDTASGTIMDLQTLLAKFVTGENGQFLNLTTGNVVIANALIKDAMIENVSLNKLKAGTINTNNINLASADGALSIVGPTMQFKDKSNRVRLQLGQDIAGDFNFILRAADGTTTLIDGYGIKEKAIADKLIKSNMVADGAIGEQQINYSSLVTGLNKDTNIQLIKASKVAIDLTGQSLEVSFNSLKSNVDGFDDRVEANTTSITVAQGQISGIITESSIIKGDITTLKDNYTIIKATVDGINTTVASHTTSITNAQNTANSANTLADSKAKVFTATPITPYKIGDIWTGGPSGEIMKCKVSRESGAYVASDWEKASKYTDDTKAVAVEGKVTIVETKQATLEQNLEGFKTTVASTYSTKTELATVNGNISSLETRIATAETKITDSAIVSTVRSSTAYTSDLSAKANQTALNSTNSNISSLTSRVTSVEQDLNGYKVTVSNTFLSKGDAVNTYATKSIMELTTNELKLNFSYSGGYNFVKNGNFQNGTAFWDKVGSPSTFAVGKYRANGYGENVLALTTTASGQQVSQQIEGLMIGRRYTVSCYIYVGSGTICMMESNQWNGAYTSGTGWQWLSFSFTPTASSFVLFIGSNDSEPTGSCHITAVAVTQGSEKLAWTPNSNEIYSGNTTIDGEGIQYTHSDGTRTKMGKDGFYWYSGTTGYGYHCLTKVGVFNVSSYGNGNWTKVKIQLPSYFKNKYFEPQCAIAGYEVGSAGVSIITALIDSYNIAEAWFVIKVFGSNNSGGYFNNINVTWVVTA
ncbi:hypothetical protein [Clostridium sp.]|uniref:hypothetical protein n=2 Tax=unclassified Clostridium TaxID=2614128 RepID=UPI0029089BF1|nr:hypothetical protein [Clostridium sp.]MDU5106541.1 hypothetical protein [Clostridium sp.]